MYQHVLVGTDGSPTATRAVEAAAQIARAHKAELTIAYAFNPHPTESLYAERPDVPDEMKWRTSPGGAADSIVHTAIELANSAADGQIRIHGRSEPGKPIEVLLDLIDELDPDVLVIGNRDMAPGLRVHRSIARTLSRRATCDVVVVDTTGRRDQRRRRRANIAA